MNPFLLAASERLADWRQFRASLVSMSDPERLTAVAAYWAQAPISIIADTEHWPPIWQMIADNVWSRNSVAIGMEATLRLAGTVSERMTLRRIRDADDVLMVLVVDQTWVLNYDSGSYRRYKFPHEVLREWHFVGKQYVAID